MGKLQPFDQKATKWEGLWWHPENHCFHSAALSLADLRKFKGSVRLYVKKNKFYNDGENNRPNYIFCLKDSKSDVFHSLEITEDENDENEERI